MKEKRYEEFLDGWLRLSAIVRNERFVKELTFQEVLVCHIIVRNEAEGKQTNATDIVEETGKLKSQVNQVLGNMERKGLLTKNRSQKDLREIYLKITPKGQERYQKEHERVLDILEKVFERLGDDRIEALMEDFEAIHQTMGKIEKEIGTI